MIKKYWYIIGLVLILGFAYTSFVASRYLEWKTSTQPYTKQEICLAIDHRHLTPGYCD